MLIHGAQNLREEDFISDAPDGLVEDFIARNRKAVFHRIAVFAEEGVHIVKIAITAVEEVTLIAVLRKRIAECG